MQKTDVMEIIKLCRNIDETARDVYAKLSNLATDKELSAFWTQMSKEESEHISFWQRTELFEVFADMPNLFEKPDEVIKDLKNALLRSRDLLNQCEEDCSIQNSFLSNCFFS